MRSFLWILVLGLPLWGSVRPEESQDRPSVQKEIPSSLRERTRSIYWLDFGVGFPQLTSIELAVQPLTRLQVGFSYGLVPGGGGAGTVSPEYKLPSQNVTLSTGLHLTLHEPTASASLSSLCPFIRYFPNATGVYFQFTLGMLKAHNTLSASLYDVNGNAIPNASATGTIDVTQYLPTLALGHLFNSKLFFFSVNMGLSMVANLNIESKFESSIPDALGGNAANQAATDQINSKNSEAASKATEEFHKLVTFLPSLQFGFGIFF